MQGETVLRPYPARARARAIVLTLTACLAGAGAGLAQEGAQEGAQEAVQEETQEPEGPELGWAGSGELSVLATRGNSETSSLGLRAIATRTWLEALLTLEASALQAEQTRVERRVVGPPEAAVLAELEETERTADSFSASGNYDRELGERLLAFGSAGWERDELSGIADRLAVAAGLGHVWADTEAVELRTRYGLGYTFEEFTSGLDDDFLNLRLEGFYRRSLTPTTELTTDLTVDENLEDTSDYRADLLASIAVSMTERLALKVSGQARYDNEPALVEVPRELPAGVPTGETVPVELEELDTRLSAALVVTW